MGAQQAECQRSQDAADYVLGKLEGRRLEAFERHLRVCERCGADVDLLQFAADAVPYLASKPARLEAEDPNPRRHLPTLDAAAAQSAARTAAIRRQMDAESGRTFAKPPLHAIAGGASTRDARRAHTLPGAQPIRSARRVLKSPVPKPAMVGFVGVAIVAVATIALSHRAASVRFERVKAGWSTGGAALRLEGNQLEILVLDMPHPKRGTGYQVWVMNKSSKQLVPTTAWLHLNSAGEAGVEVPGNYHAWDAAAVYVEPLHGHETTKSGAVVVADLRREA